MILDATIANGSYKTVASIDMPRNAHALMQNTYPLRLHSAASDTR
jgi:hypothetical protein